MSAIHDLGVILGNRLKPQTAAVKPDKIVVPAPVVQVTNEVGGGFDFEPMGKSIASAIEANKTKPVDVVGAAQVLANALNDIGVVDLDPVKTAIYSLVDAVSAADKVDIALLVGALDRQTAAIELQTKAIQDQNTVLSKSKSVEYDDQGRILRVKVG